MEMNELTLLLSSTLTPSGEIHFELDLNEFKTDERIVLIHPHSNIDFLSLCTDHAIKVLDKNKLEENTVYSSAISSSYIRLQLPSFGGVFQLCRLQISAQLKFPNVDNKCLLVSKSSVFIIPSFTGLLETVRSNENSGIVEDFVVIETMTEHLKNINKLSVSTCINLKQSAKMSDENHIYKRRKLNASTIPTNSSSTDLCAFKIHIATLDEENAVKICISYCLRNIANETDEGHNRKTTSKYSTRWHNHYIIVPVDCHNMRRLKQLINTSKIFANLELTYLNYNCINDNDNEILGFINFNLPYLINHDSSDSSSLNLQSRDRDGKSITEDLQIYCRNCDIPLLKKSPACHLSNCQMLSTGVFDSVSEVVFIIFVFKKLLFIMHKTFYFVYLYR